MTNPYHEALGRAPRAGKPRKAKPSPSHVRAKKQEREIAGRLSRAKLVPRSGAGDVKGDVRVKNVLRIECKTTKHSSFSVTLDMVRKIEEAATSTGEMPAIIIEFNDSHGRKLHELAVVPVYALNELCRE